MLFSNIIIALNDNKDAMVVHAPKDFWMWVNNKTPVLEFTKDLEPGVYSCSIEYWFEIGEDDEHSDAKCGYRVILPERYNLFIY